MHNHVIKNVTAEHQKGVAKIGWKPGVVPLTVKAPWHSVVEWSSESYDRDRVPAGVGALVGPRHVLTCAQRVDPKMDERLISEGSLPTADKVFRVRIGGPFGLDCEVQQVIPHPKFRPITVPSRLPRKSMDLAILVLAEDVDIPPVRIAPRKLLRLYERISALGTGPLSDGPYDPIQFDTAGIHPLAGATGKPWGKEFVVANAPGSDGMGPGFLGAPVVMQAAGADDAQLVGLVSRPAPGLPTEEALGAPCVAVDVTRYTKWIANTIAPAYLVGAKTPLGE